MTKTGRAGEVMDLPDSYGVGVLGIGRSIGGLRPAFGGKDRGGRHPINEAIRHWCRIFAQPSTLRGFGRPSEDPAARSACWVPGCSHSRSGQTKR